MVAFRQQGRAPCAARRPAAVAAAACRDRDLINLIGPFPFIITHREQSNPLSDSLERV